MKLRMAWMVALCVVAVVDGGASARAADPDALWKIVHGRCVPDEQAHGDPKPCVSVDSAGGTVVLKDNVGATQFLLIPTTKITGIESPEILAADAPNYFAAAWAVRSDIDAVLGRKLLADDIGLAINSEKARTQNQLHIHVDCLSISVIEALHGRLADIGEAWSPFPVPLAGHEYLARRIDPTRDNPFKLLADGIPGAAATMGYQTLVLAGATFPDGRPGAVLLADHVDLLKGDLAGGEQLQDHSCAVANATGQ